MSNGWLARLCAPLWCQPGQGLLLVSAVLMAVAMLQAPNLVAANTSAHAHWVSLVLMWSVCAGLINGMGWQPRSLPVRLLLFPWLALLLNGWGLWLTRSYFLG